MNEYLRKIVDGEDNMHEAIYNGFNTTGVKTCLIKRLIKERDGKEKFNVDNAMNVLDIEINDSQDPQSCFRAQRERLENLAEHKFSETEIHKFDI
jgi:hypothetical protein